MNEGKDVNAFISILGTRALAKAGEVDKKLWNNNARSLAGLVIAIKDNIHSKGERWISRYQMNDELKKIDIHRINFEEDADQSIHNENCVGENESLIDVNRRIVPLVAIVMHPVSRTLLCL